MPRFGGIGRGSAAWGLIGATVTSLVVSHSVAFAQPTDADAAMNPALVSKAQTRAAAVYESGIASTYGTGDGFEGNRTACGQIFRTNVVQVAHKSLPCGTVIRIEDVDTGRSVVAEVTDRGPYVKGRIVDLSWAAYRQLDPSGPGLLNVNIYLVN
jgi:rare lipoprotein A